MTAGLTSCHYPGIHDNIRLQSQCLPSLRDSQIIDILQPVIARFDGHSDVPWPGLIEGLRERYPNGRFVLLTRRPEDWWQSVLRHWRLNLVPRRLTNFEAIQYRPYIGTRRFITRDDMKTMLDAYEAHSTRVRSVFNTANFLEASLDDPSLARKLSDFLNIGEGVAFPRLQNKTAVRPTLLSLKRIGRFAIYLPHYLMEPVSK